MKRLITILALVSLVGCQKDYNCTIHTCYDGTCTDISTTFTGTKEEMKEYEAYGTVSGSITQTTTCK
jgi:hypothetical protein